MMAPHQLHRVREGGEEVPTSSSSVAFNGSTGQILVTGSNCAGRQATQTRKQQADCPVIHKQLQIRHLVLQTRDSRVAASPVVFFLCSLLQFVSFKKK